jgi:excisionase family DNA binding protein
MYPKSSGMIDLENDPEFMTAAEIAKVLHIATSYAYLLMQRKEIPTVRIGRSIRVRRVDLEKYINDHYQKRHILK